MKKTYLAAFLAAVMLMPGCSVGRKTQERYTESSFEVFDTATVVTGYEDNKESFDEKSGFIISCLNEYHKLYDIYNDYDGINNLKTVNDNAGAAPVTVDRRIIDLLKKGTEIYALTDGMTNIAMGSVLSVWHDYREAGTEDPENAQLPPSEILKKAAEHTDINNIIIDQEKSTVYLADPEMSLDVGALAKGYATEMIARDCENKGYTAYALSVGGNVRTIGTKPDGKSWNIGIQNPFLEENQTYFCKVAPDSLSLVTSGSYQRYYTVDGVKYHHIISPLTLMPENKYVSVSVLCPDSGTADALSTALFNMDVEDGISLVESIDNTEAVWVYPDGTKKYTSGFETMVTEWADGK